ncbi:unnamed protein product [Caenorhabditis bovis]|uniref:U3 small nucleolar RNA-associated protein 20 N-terminal domain-containing protein n=1 Tax=Caenorhabditis bovis TaxID=2654633 RepID=A0A8S1EMI2_9PELO|nr:unnamed protein product [Caenorhabditis bovis]
MDLSDEDELFARYYEAKKKQKTIKRHLSFNERIAQMGGDNGKFSRRINAENHNETYFEDALDDWRNEDQGPDLESFVNAMKEFDVKTYAQLLHKSEQVFNILVEHITKPNCRSIPAFCGILAAFARDLRDKFAPHLWKSLELLFNILDIGARHAENVEAAYVCLSIIVKTQSNLLCRQLKKAFRHFIALFASSRDFARRFAAESFAFLLRKSTDLRAITIFIMKEAFKNPHHYLSDGCALLFYNTFVGIAGSFHSNSSQILRDIVHSSITCDDSAKNPEFLEFCTKIIVQVVGYTIDYAKNSKYDNRHFYQHVLTKLLADAKNVNETTAFMRILLPCIVEKNEELMNEVNRKKMRKEKANKKNKGLNKMKNAEKLVFECGGELRVALEAIVNLDDFELNSNIVTFISEALLTIFNDDKNRLFSKDFTLNIVKKTKNHDLAIELLLKTCQLESFDLYLMPALGQIAADIIKDYPKVSKATEKITRFYSYLCCQRRSIQETIERGATRANFFDLTHHYAYRDWIIRNFQEYQSIDDVPQLIDMLVSWPWLFSSTENVKGVEFVEQMAKTLVDVEDSTIRHSQLILACVAGIYSAKKSSLNAIPRDSIEKFVRRQSCSESSLLVFEMILDVNGTSESVDELNRVVELLLPAMKSENEAERRTALRILCNFRVPMPTITDENGKCRQQTETIFEILHEAECSELTNFRERLLHFRKIRYEQHKEFIPNGSDVESVERIIVNALASQFFVNFSPLWKGIHEILTSFARGLNIDVFWSVMGDWIQNVTMNLKKTASDSNGRHLHGIDEVNRSDFANARVQILEFFQSIPDIAERRTRILSPILLGIYDDFLRLTSSSSSSHQVDTSEEVTNDEVEVDDDDDDDDDNVPLKEKNGSRKEVALTIKALQALLLVFAKFTAAKATYMEDKLREMYENLISTKYEGIQRAALACIFTYRNNILNNYRENLEKLIDEKQLRNALATFKLSSDEGDASVIDEHRAVVVPILLRILRGKLQINGKQKGMVSRRNGIINVIGGCRSDELAFFLKLYFSQIYQMFAG